MDASNLKWQCGCTSANAERQNIEPVVLVHGGAGSGKIAASLIPSRLEGVKRAALAGYRALVNSNGTVLDAVEASVCVMEDDEMFNAGKLAVQSVFQNCVVQERKETLLLTNLFKMWFNETMIARRFFNENK